jgi:hypothetical protein
MEHGWITLERMEELTPMTDDDLFDLILSGECMYQNIHCIIFKDSRIDIMERIYSIMRIEDDCICIDIVLGGVLKIVIMGSIHSMCTEFQMNALENFYQASIKYNFSFYQLEDIDYDMMCNETEEQILKLHIFNGC